jgi:hypothetical protein
MPRYFGHNGDSVLLRSWSTNGIPLPRFQWFRNGSPLPGATNATYSLTSLHPANAGFYAVLVSNALGTVTYTTEVGVEQPALQPELRLNDMVLRLWLPIGTNVHSVVETSTNLIDWHYLRTYSPLEVNTSIEVSITNATQQFFRTRQLQ